MTTEPLLYELKEGRFRTPGGNAVRMTYRHGTNDWNTLNASLDGDEYLLPRGLSGHALDIGGYLGSVGIALALDNPDMTVTIVEPVPPNADLIARNIDANGVADRVALVRGAVGSGGEPVDVWYGYTGSESLLHHAFVGNSSLAYDHGGEHPHDTITYVALGLSDFRPPDFLKIDCEGGEWAFLGSGAGAAVPVIVGEAHAVRGHKGSDIVAMLPGHDVAVFGDVDGTCGFRAVRQLS